MLLLKLGILLSVIVLIALAQLYYKSTKQIYYNNYTDMDYSISTVYERGRRDEQQDYYKINYNKVKNELYILLADGMGGMSNGALASKKAVDISLDYYNKNGFEIGDYRDFLKKSIYYTNSRVGNMPEFKNDKGGTTIILMIIKDNCLYFASVGDSRIALYRKSKLIKLNREHIFANLLEDLVNTGSISLEEAKNNPHRRDITSYIGIKELRAVDICKSPIKLEEGDIILALTDGIYNTLSQGELENALMVKDTEKIKQKIEKKIKQKNKKHQDNYTAIIVRRG